MRWRVHTRIRIRNGAHETHVPETNSQNTSHSGTPVFGCTFDVCWISGIQHIAQYGCQVLQLTNLWGVFKYKHTSHTLALTVCLNVVFPICRVNVFSFLFFCIQRIANKVGGKVFRCL